MRTHSQEGPVPIAEWSAALPLTVGIINFLLQAIYKDTFTGRACPDSRVVCGIATDCRNYKLLTAGYL